MYHFLLSKGLEILKISSVSGAQPNLSTENIKNLVIPVPPLEVQEEIAKILEKDLKSIDNAIQRIRKKSETWIKLYEVEI